MTSDSIGRKLMKEFDGKARPHPGPIPGLRLLIAGRDNASWALPLRSTPLGTTWLGALPSPQAQRWQGARFAWPRKGLGPKRKWP